MLTEIMILAFTIPAITISSNLLLVAIPVIAALAVMMGSNPKNAAYASAVLSVIAYFFLFIYH